MNIYNVRTLIFYHMEKQFFLVWEVIIIIGVLLKTPRFSLEHPYFHWTPPYFRERPDISAGDPQILVSLIKIWGSPKRRSWGLQRNFHGGLQWKRFSNGTPMMMISSPTYFFSTIFLFLVNVKPFLVFFSCELVMMNSYIMAAFSFLPCCM